MKAESAILMVLPAFFCAISLVYSKLDDPLPNLFFGGLWALSAFACLGWAYFIRRQHPRLAWACVVFGCLHLAIIVLPALTPAKTRAHASTEPAHFSQEPSPLLFSATEGGKPLSGFVGAWLSAAVAERNRSQR